MSELSEQAYLSGICNNPLACEELALIHEALERDPYSIGSPVGIAHDFLDYRAYETPRLTKRPRLRVFYTVDGWERVVSIEAIQLQ